MRKINYEENFEKLDSIVVQHKHFSAALKKLTASVTTAKRYADPKIILLLGESRTGKSRVLEIIQQQFPVIRTDEKRKVPVIRIRVNRKPTVKGLMHQLLYELGDAQIYKSRTEAAMFLALITLLRNCEVQALLLDEFQHFLSARLDITYEVADLFKAIAEDANVTIVLSGLPIGRTIVEGNEQLSGRSARPINIPRFDWKKPKSRNDFLNVIVECARAISPIESPDFQTGDWGFRWYCATGGLIGYVMKIFQTVLDDAAERKTDRLTIADYNSAYQEALFDVPTSLEPFKLR